ncbi:sulfurtransferase [Thiohalobacter sp. IOR34]|uniref:sulfurtransferase n=1 Tax=Thiohalobacter sp. IOR34 TaxID=3057176 RepID=UPI0025AF4623|nr:sulfurtransferase [Thiohalobacter sp. IOR34]WJW76327.1 sulfurtransferase [Thiohalobacter sp. IOR34]
MASLPILLDPARLEEHLGDSGLLVVDLSRAEHYARHHVPGAVHLDYARLIASRQPVMGLLPPAAALATLFGELGITPDTHVVACDDEGGGKAGRLLWTLDAMGHGAWSLLDGGLHAWAAEGHPLDSQPVEPRPAAPYPVQENPAVIATAEELLQRLGDPQLGLLDARSEAEYIGAKAFAARAGHIPGAVNFEWTEAMQRHNNLRLRPLEELRAELAGLGLTPDREIVSYCQTHHRSSHSYVMLKALGYERIKGYPGSWSDWGNRSDTPIET